MTSQFLKKKEQFVYVRRYKSDFKHASKLQFFDAISKLEKFQGVKFRVNGNLFYINDEVAGYFVTLATAQDLKGSNFDKVGNVFFDEFIIEKGQKNIIFKMKLIFFLDFLKQLDVLEI